MDARRIEDELRASEQRLRSVIEAEAAARRNAVRLGAVVEAQRELAASPGDEAQLLGRIAGMAQGLFEADGAAYEALERGRLRVRGVCGISDLHVGTEFPLDGSLSGLAVLEQATLRSEDVGTDPRSHQTGVPIEWRSLMATPLRLGRETVGVIAVMARQVAYFTQEDQHALELLAESLGAVLQRRRDAEQLHASEQAYRAELEERVKQRTEQLQAANAELEAFSYSIAHDLRSPLTSIDGFSRVLEECYGDQLDDKGRHYLQRIQAGVRQMSELTDAMLSLAHLSRISLKSEPVDLAEAARVVFGQLREREPQRAAAVLDAPQRLWARGDPRLLQQVMTNLVGNAWKFSARSAQTFIRVGSQPGAHCETVYFVQDRGAGFDMKHAGRLFGAFQRLHTPSEFEGTGVGLALVQKVVIRHGGRIWAESQPGGGATFYFTLAA
jgi:signal transduction histidine kinase